MEIISFILDVFLVIAAVVAFLARPRIGGQLAKGLQTLLVGVVILGLAHMVETVLFVVFNLDRETNEVLHRLLIGAGFVFVIWGFFTIRRAFHG